jgi:hypothetical protein
LLPAVELAGTLGLDIAQPRLRAALEETAICEG